MSQISIDLTTLENYNDLTSGETYSVTVVAKGNPNLFIDSNPSTGVNYTVPASYTITTNLTHCTASGSNPSVIYSGSTATLVFNADFGYYCNNIGAYEVTNATIDSQTISVDQNTITLVIKNPTGNVSISYTAGTRSYSITYNLTNLTKGYSPNYIMYGYTDNITLESNVGYVAPLTANDVTVTNATISNFNRSDSSAYFYLTPDGNGDITITASDGGIRNYPITVSATNITPDVNNPSTVNINTPVTLTFNTGTGYKVPDSANDITVTNATKGTYTKVSNTQCTLVISNPTYSVDITLSGVPDAPSAYTLTLGGEANEVGNDDILFITINRVPADETDYDYRTADSSEYYGGNDGLYNSSGTKVAPYTGNITINDVSYVYIWGGYGSYDDGSSLPDYYSTLYTINGSPASTDDGYERPVYLTGNTTIHLYGDID